MFAVIKTGGKLLKTISLSLKNSTLKPVKKSHLTTYYWPVKMAMSKLANLFLKALKLKLRFWNSAKPPKFWFSKRSAAKHIAVSAVIVKTKRS